VDGIECGGAVPEIGAESVLGEKWAVWQIIPNVQRGVGAVAGLVQSRRVARRVERLEPDFAAGKDGPRRNETGRRFHRIAVHASWKRNLVVHGGLH
jgi:hypothetical protein